ncbi:MAG: polysaccharide biosynthesis/export family protein [Acidobacteriaceae bacterium]|nr:polysaccharide biosynthesis/export family protein [Acidobacteriaceae bacterium]
MSSYTIGPGDVLAISFSNSPELNEKIQVSRTGDISVPLLSSPIHAGGLTPLELSEKVAKALEEAKQLHNPYVSIYVEEHNSHFATVLGAVARPGIYPLVRPTTLLELISMAGGVATSAGGTVTVAHAADDEGTGATGASTISVQLSEVKDNKDPSLNVAIHSGDVVNVSSAPVIYVVGAVGKPGVFVLQDPQFGITVLEALAEAQGLQSTASASHSLVIRHGDVGKQKELIPVDVAQIMKGKSTDQELQPNDILFIPESQTKKSLQAMARIAETSVAQIAGYGLGLRVGGVY